MRTRPVRATLCNQTHRKFNSRLHAALTRAALAGNIKRGAVIGAGTHNWQADSHIDGFVPAEQFHRNQPLIVVHGHHQVPLARRRCNEYRVTRKWTVGINTYAPRGLDRRANDTSLFVTKHAVLACMRIQTADRNAWLGNTQLLTELMPKINRVVDLTNGQYIANIHERQVRRCQRYPQARRTKHHRVSLGLGAERKQFRVPRPLESGDRPTLFADRARHHGIKSARIARRAHRVSDGIFNKCFGKQSAKSRRSGARSIKQTFGRVIKHQRLQH